MKRVIGINGIIFYRRTMERMEDIRDALQSILQAEDDILFAYLYGSVGRGMDRPDSDIDVGIFLANPQKMDRYYPEQPAVRLEKTVGREVDVRVLNGRNLAFLHQVLSRGILLFSRDERPRVQFESTVYDHYLDISYYMKQYDAIRRKELLA